MRNRLGVLAASLCLASVASAAAGPSKQALYDQAQAAMDRSDWAAAANGFTPLLPSDPTKPLSQSQAIIAARLGEALMHQGRVEEARGWLSRAIANLPKQTGLTDTWIEAAESARFAYDYEAAAKADQVAVELATAANDARTLSLARVGLAQAVMTSDPNRAANALDAVLASDANGMEPLARAQLEQLRARAAIIAGDRSAAEHWIKSALSRSGGLTELKVSTVQAEIRADAAIIARLSGNDEGSREYLSYTGAGHLKNMDWLSRREGAQPACDPDGGVQPDDSVVVRFVIGDDGRVQAAIPVYASRPGPAGVLFAEAVSRWHWAPEELKDVAAYWRGTLRLELRCQSRPAPKTLDEPFHQESVKWLAKTGHLGAVPADDAAALDHAALSSTDPLAELIFPSAFHPLSPFSYEDGERALTAAGAPASVYAMMIYVYAVMHSGGGIRESAGRRADNLGKIVPAFLERAPKEKASYWLELEWALALESAGRFAQAQPLVAQVLSTPEAVLPADDPIRQVAQLHAALIAAQLGTPAAAPSTAGLDAQQCSLLDTHPVPTKAGLSSDIFPKEALRWGFEGHVEEEFDIGSDGRVAHVRTVLAYPPFIFGPDTERAIHDFRYVPPSIGGKAVGCNSQTVRINYRLPG